MMACTRLESGATCSRLSLLAAASSGDSLLHTQTQVNMHSWAIYTGQPRQQPHPLSARKGKILV